MTFDIVIYLLAGLNVVLALWILNLEWRLKKVFRGRGIQDLESIIKELALAVDETIKKGEHDDRLFEDIYRRLKRTIQKFHTVRFNPFPDHGGNQSFATAFMDEDGNGVVISSLYARDKASVYAKPLTAFGSEHELTEEEKNTIEEAKKRV